jgi:hypothetical protein
LQAEQEHTRTRWTVVTFFMSISFALFGLSFQNKLAPPNFSSCVFQPCLSIGLP